MSKAKAGRLAKEAASVAGKSGLINAVWSWGQKNGLSISKTKAGELTDFIFNDHIVDTLRRTGRFAYPSFGSFSVRPRKARQVITNLQARKHDKTVALEKRTIPETRAAVWRPSPALREGMGKWKVYSRGSTKV